MSILGNEVKRVEDPRFLTGEAIFVSDVAIRATNPAESRPTHAVFARSTMAHARVLSIATADAKTAPGVRGVFTMADLDVAIVPTWGPVPPGTERTAMATDKVRFVGEPYAVVVADTAEQAADAAELVWADYEPLPAVTNPLIAAEDHTVLFEDFGTNVVSNRGYDKPLDFSDCDVVISAPIVNNRMSAAPIEPRVALVRWDNDHLTVWSSTQSAHSARDQIAAVAKLDTDKIRVIVPDVGGSFGAKGGPAPEECILPLLARAVDAPVQWVETRTENLQSMGWSRAQWQTITMGGTADGTITHYQLEVVGEIGAYAEAGVFMPTFTRMMTQGVYDIANVAFMGKTVLCNTAPLVAFRGAGRPEACAAVERAVDLFAAKAGLDPAGVRAKNVIAPTAFPFTSKVGTVYDSGDYGSTLEQALTAADYPALRAEQQARRDRGDVKQLGIGLSCYVEVTAPGGAPAIKEFGSVELTADGKILARSGSTPFGQGHHTTWAMIVADKLGVPMADVTVITGDTDAIPSSNTTGGSRSVQIAGSAMADASQKLVDAAKPLAADVLEASVDDITHNPETGDFHVVGTPARSVSWAQIAEAAPQALVLENDFAQTAPTFPFGTHICVVEVDTETGGVDVQRFVGVDDAGTLINPLLAAGQVHGGIAAGIAQALLEDGTFDDDGNLISSNFADYAIISVAEVPQFERHVSVTPTPLNPLGAKGIGESGSIGATPAVQNAVIDAVSHLGVTHIDMPLTPQRVWDALRTI